MQNPTAKALAVRLRRLDYTTESQLTKRYFTLRSRGSDRLLRSNAREPKTSSESVAGSGTLPGMDTLSGMGTDLPKLVFSRM